MKPRYRTEDRTVSLRAKRLWPFLSVVVVTVPLTLVGRSAGSDFGLVFAAFGLMGAVGVAVVLVPWPHLPRAAVLVPVAAFCAGVGMLRESGGGAGSGYGALLLLPVVWLAVYTGFAEVVAATVMTTATLALPLLLIGGQSYPAEEWRRVVLTAMTFNLTGLVVNQLVTRLGDQQASLTDLLARLDDMAHHDQLTGTFNRRAWDEMLDGELDRRSSESGTGVLAMIDLDHFKVYNDRHGHLAGDHLLAAASRAWSAELRSTDVLARWGGEEFILLLPDTTVAQGVSVLDRLRDVTPESQNFSAGLVELSGHQAAPLVRTVDAALYRAKAAGRACTVVAAEPDRATAS